MALSVNDFTAGTAITASAMNANFASIENYVNSSPGMAALTGATFSGLVTANGGLTAGGTLSFTGAAVFTVTNGAFTVTNGACSIKNLAFTGTLSGTNSVPRVAYNAGGVATVASNQLDANPTLFVCPAAVAPNALAAGDIWFAL